MLVQGHRWPEHLLAAQGVRWDPNLDSTAFRGRSHSHTPTLDCNKADMPVHLARTPQDVGEGKDPEKTCEDMGRKCQLHTVAPAGSQFFPLSTLEPKGVE